MYALSRQGAAFTTALLLAILPLRDAHAGCADPDLLVAFPDDGAVDVPTDATLSARYAASAEYLDEEVLFGRAGDGGALDPVPVAFDPAEVRLSIELPGGLEPETTYRVQWPRLRGLGSASKGDGRVVEFTTGTGADREAPTFTGLEAARWDVRRRTDDCTGAAEDRFVFDLDVGAASDDASAGSLAVLLYQTRGPGLDESDPAELLGVLALPDPGRPLRVARTVSDGVGKVCFAAAVRDLTGKTSGGADREVCAFTTAPPYFLGCAAAPTRRAPLSDLGLACSALAIAGLVRRRRSEP